jgi:hypothetical protein
MAVTLRPARLEPAAQRAPADSGRGTGVIRGAARASAKASRPSLRGESWFTVVLYRNARVCRPRGRPSSHSIMTWIARGTPSARSERDIWRSSPGCPAHDARLNLAPAPRSSSSAPGVTASATPRRAPRTPSPHIDSPSERARRSLLRPGPCRSSAGSPAPASR